MSSLFTQIIAGELPARFVWSDDRAVAFLVLEPLTAGHTIVVPRHEVDQWVDVDDDLLAHLMSVAKRIGAAQRAEWAAARAGLMVEGFAVPHLHVHVWPANGPKDFDPHAVDHSPQEAALDESADRLRSRLRRLGYADHVPVGDGPADG